MPEVSLTSETKMECGKAATLVSALTLNIETDVLIDHIYIGYYKTPEWATVLLGEDKVDEDGKRKIVVKDWYMPNQKVSGSTFEFDDDWEKIKAQVGEAKIVGILHRHPGTLSTHSGTDSEFIFGATPINIIMHDGDGLENRFSAYAGVYLPCDRTCFKVIPIKISVLYNITRNIKEIADAAIKAKTYAYTSRSSYAEEKSKEVTIYRGNGGNGVVHSPTFQSQENKTAIVHTAPSIVYPTIDEADMSVLCGCFGGGV